jgi:K+-transporting ATPase ATPase B chain
MGVLQLKDILKSGMRERFAELRRMGIRTVMITGDNPLTAASIAAEAGIDDFLAEATPEDKLALIRREQTGGRLIAMCGDGTNDAPALAQADVGLTMNTGTQAAREAGNMVDLDSDPTKLIEVVGLGKQLLMTRGALTTFSVANDVAKYFAIIPAIFVILYPGLGVLNIMHLHSSTSAVLSAIIFNEVSPGTRCRGAAPQPRSLRRRRDHRAVHRHQADRSHRHRSQSRLKEAGTWIARPFLHRRSPRRLKDLRLSVPN